MNIVVAVGILGGAIVLAVTTLLFCVCRLSAQISKSERDINFEE